MKIKTQDLTGAALDWAVAKCEGVKIIQGAKNTLWLADEPDNDATEWSPSTNWAQGGPIIEREWLEITPWPNESDENMRWQCIHHDYNSTTAYGPTPLVAAMRCYVARKMGDEVDVPDEVVA